MQPPFPCYIQLYPTLRCNQRCAFCFNEAMPSFNNARDLSHENARRLMDIVAEANIPEIDIMGGEPLLLRWMPDFLREASSRGFRVNISTNGSLPEMIRRFADTDFRKVTIGISLEGSTAEKHNRQTLSGHFEDAVRSLQILKSSGRNPLVKTVITRATIHDIPAIVSLLRGLGVRRYYLIHMDVMSKDPALRRAASAYPDFLSFYRRIKDEHRDMEIQMVAASCFHTPSLPTHARCAGGVLKLAVAPDGSAFPCNLFIGRSEFLLGNVFSDDINKIWDNPKLDFFRSGRDNVCPDNGCSNRSVCTGGCPAHGFYHHGDMWAPDIRCRAGR